MAPTKEKILVLDDEPHILDLIQMRLESQGYEVITAATGDEALAKARSTVVDMAVMDLMLGDGPNGIQVMEQLLLINPHTSFFFRHEAQVTSEEGLNAYGAATWGQFFVYQGWNDRLGWMHTSSGADVTDDGSNFPLWMASTDARPRGLFRKTNSPASFLTSSRLPRATALSTPEANSPKSARRKKRTCPSMCSIRQMANNVARTSSASSI